MKVSIVIPCFNDGKYLKEVLPYALEQTYENKEIIIVNDGSTDSFTNKYLKEVQVTEEITVIDQTNKGLGKARNIGIERANGDLILTWDADDYYEVSFLSKAVPLIISDNSVKVVTSGVRHFGTYNDTHMPKEGGVSNLLKGNSLPASALFRKLDWEVIRGYDEDRDLATYADWDFWIRLLKKGGTIKVLSEYLFNYRVTTKSMYLSQLDRSQNLIAKVIQKNDELFLRESFQIIEKLHFERLLQYQRLRELRIEKNEIINSKYNESKLFYLKKFLGL